MTNKSERDDFRSDRRMLPPEAFAISEGIDIPPTDLVPRDVWDGIMHLPDDVALRTSGHNGTRLHLLYELWGDWVDAIGLEREDEIFDSMLDAADCLQSTNFNYMHGFYRTALADLRTAFELTMIGTYGQLHPSDPDYRAWKIGNTDNFGFSLCRKRLWQTLDRHQSRWIFERDGLLATQFKTLCNFTHSRPDASDGALWQSNGPVYNNAAVLLVLQTALEVYARCHLLVHIARPQAPLPENSEILFELDWMPTHSKLVQARTEIFGPKPPSDRPA